MAKKRAKTIDTVLDAFKVSTADFLIIKTPYKDGKEYISLNALVTLFCNCKDIVKSKEDKELYQDLINFIVIIKPLAHK